MGKISSPLVYQASEKKDRETYGLTLSTEFDCVDQAPPAKTKKGLIRFQVGGVGVNQERKKQAVGVE